jgi:Protein of unknown function (DUF3106)
MLIDCPQAAPVVLPRTGFVRLCVKIQGVGYFLVFGLITACCMVNAQVNPVVASANTQRATPITPSNTVAEKAETGTRWGQLKPNEQHVLTPLKTLWPTLSAGHKNKWISLADRFEKMKPEERIRVTQRMGEWATLKPEQRTIARIQFAEVQALDPQARFDQWQAYQALSTEERSALQMQAAKPKVGVAPAVKLGPASKSVVTAQTQQSPAMVDATKSVPKISIDQIDSHTLLPQQEQ